MSGLIHVLMRTGRRFVPVLLAAAMIAPLGLLAGCAFKGGEPGGGETAARARSAWRPKPVDLRIYPSTRFTREGDTPILETRVELLDQMGDAIKGVGEFRVELFARSHVSGFASLTGGAAGPTGRQLYTWRVPITTLQEQRQFYDSITQAYLLRLRLGSDASSLAKKGALLRVVFSPVQGPRLDAQAQVGGKGGD